MRILLNKKEYFTGDTMVLEARLIENNRRLIGATVKAKIKRPESCIGKWHFDHRILQSQIDQVPNEISGEPLTQLDKSNYVLLQQMGAELPEIITEPEITLKDEGRDGDKYPNDGIYAEQFSGFVVPGIYKIQITTSGTTYNSQEFKRQNEVHKFVDMIPDADKTQKEGTSKRGLNTATL